jgi:hypothetical protein
MGGPTPTIPLTAADESYTHQLVAPHLQTQYVHPAWGDRCYHQLHVEDLAINLGRQLYPHDGRRFAFAGIATPERMYCLRAAEPFAPGDDPNQATIGSVTIEVVRPLQEIRLRAVDPDFPVSLDLTFTGRFAPVATDRNVIEVRGEVVTDYMNFFQSGLYTGTITVEGRRYEVRDRAGFRDRGWGIRKHESSSRRGIVVAVFCELEDRAIYALLYETASGRRARSRVGRHAGHRGKRGDHLELGTRRADRVPQPGSQLPGRDRLCPRPGAQAAGNRGLRSERPGCGGAPGWPERSGVQLRGRR